MGQVINRSNRWQFWKQLLAIIQKNSGVFMHYLTSCAHIEHFLEYRQIIWEEVEAERLDYSLLKSKDTVL